jgi:hypothetical protein
MTTHYRQISLVLVNMISKLAIPIYLDTNALPDILASIEDGFSMSDNATAYSSDSKNTQLYLGAQRRIVYSILTGIVLGRNGLSRGKSYEKVEMGEALDHLYNSKKILENFISALTEVARQNKEKLAELDFARRFVKALAEDGGGKGRNDIKHTRMSVLS